MSGPRAALLAFALALICGCSGGGSSAPAAAPGGSSGGGAAPPPAPQRLYADPAQVALSAADVEQTLARAIQEAEARGTPATIAVVDRVGNVLAVFAMTGARTTQAIPKARDGSARDLQGLDVPATLAAISKAITGAYLSSSGNAFSTRTASMIVQEHFPPSPATAGLEGGPLFGVQFSQLPCSDLVTRDQGGAGPGPHRAPLGLAADPGGFPLYKDGVVVGGVGVAADGDYGFDPNVLDFDSAPDEAIALAAAAGLAAPEAIRADRIAVDGTLLRFSDIAEAQLLRAPANAPNFSTLDGRVGALVSVRGYFDGSVRQGLSYGSEASGVRAAGAGFANPDAYVLTDGAGATRFSIRAGGDPIATPLTASEVTALLEEAFAVMSAARAQIRQPLNSRAQVSISVVDSEGRVLGLVRSPDAPIFGIDVSLQKARSAAFFSSPAAAADLTAVPALVGYVARVRADFADPTALTGGFAISAKAIGNIARPYYPDGELGRPPGPLAPPIAEWSPFATGLQSNLITADVVTHVTHVLTASPDALARCGSALPEVAAGVSRLQNGLQIFSGAVPIYRGTTLVGAIGVSGDGIDQDDMIAFLGLDRAGKRLGGAIANAPSAIRADQLSIDGVRLRYVNCPFSPFLESSAQNVCQGL